MSQRPHSEFLFLFPIPLAGLHREAHLCPLLNPKPPPCSFWYSAGHKDDLPREAYSQTGKLCLSAKGRAQDNRQTNRQMGGSCFLSQSSASLCLSLPPSVFGSHPSDDGNSLAASFQACSESLGSRLLRKLLQDEALVSLWASVPSSPERQHCLHITSLGWCRVSLTLESRALDLVL